MIVVARGITRTVWLVGRWAVKVPSLRRYGSGLAGLLWSITRGIQANLSEREWSGLEGDDVPDRGLLCPLRWSLLGGIINVYPRCVPWPVDEHGAALRPLPETEIPLGDDKPENWGLLGGRPVRIDYDVSYNGCPHDRGGVETTRARGDG